MKKIYALIIIILLILAVIFSIGSKRFYKHLRPAASLFKKSHAIKNWMESRIQKDLKSFHGAKIKQSDIDKALAVSPHGECLLLKVIIKNNEINIIGDSDNTINHQRAGVLKTFFQSLSLKYRLPNCAMLFSLHDQFDLGREGCENYDILKIPIFVFAKNKNSSNRILFPDFEAFNNDKLIKKCQKASKNHPWQQKKEIVFFRGATTNKIVNLDNFLENPRFRLVHMSRKQPDVIDAAFALIDPIYKNFPSEICPLTSKVLMKDHFVYKYLIDIDGHGCTYSRCRWILLSNSVMLKSDSDNILWYYDNLTPYKHFIPIKKDLSDLETVIGWLKSHDKQAREIAKNATELGEEIFSTKAVELYVVKLLNSYVKIFDAESLKK